MNASADFFAEARSRDVETWRDILAVIQPVVGNLCVGAIKGSAPHLLSDPAAWCALHLTGDETAHVASGIDDPKVRLSAHLAESMGAHWAIVFSFELNGAEFVDSLPDLVRAFGPTARVAWGRASTNEAGLAVAGGLGRTGAGPDFFRDPPFPMAIPGCVDWVNWWSDASCRELGFSLEDPRAALFARIIEVPGHGLVLQLTDEIIDLTKFEHAVNAVYQAFPDIDRKWGI